MPQLQVSSNKRTLAPKDKYMYENHLMLVSYSCLNFSCALTPAPLCVHVTVQACTSTIMLIVSPAFNYYSPSISIFF